MENASTKSVGGKPADNESLEIAITLDLTGLKCPLPVLKARRQTSQMATGDRLDVLADDPAAPLDFEHFCSTGRHELVETRSDGAVFTFCIRVGANPSG